MSTKNLYTTGKIAKTYGIEQKEIKDAISELNIEPDLIKGSCKYYTAETAEKIRKKAKI